MTDSLSKKLSNIDFDDHDIILETEICQFIKNFKQSNVEAIEDLFLHGNCYWFAFILKSEFGGQLVYDPIECHFMCYIDKGIYDITGKIDDPALEELYFWEDYKELDYLSAARTEFYCKDLKDAL